jgi:hypothetical protein
VAVVDYRLADSYEGIRLGQALRSLGLSFLLVSGYLNTAVVVEAMKAGAIDVLEKPLDRETFVGVVGRAFAAAEGEPRTTGTCRDCPTDHVESAALTTVTIRWSRMVLGACAATDDPRTVLLWGRFLAVSSATIEETCRMCGVTAHGSRDLARFLRALARTAATGDVLRNHFAVADERTVDRLFAQAALPKTSKAVPIKAFLSHQTFVPTTIGCFRELAHMAANSPFFFQLHC